MNIRDAADEVFRLICMTTVHGRPTANDDQSSTYQDACNFTLSFDDDESSQIIHMLKDRIQGSYGPPDYARECSYFFLELVQNIVRTSAALRRQALISACTLQFLHGQSHTAVHSTQRILGELGATGVQILVDIDQCLGDGPNATLIISLLAASEDRGAIPTLIARLASPRAHIRLAAIRALRNFNSPTLFDPLSHLCHDDEAELRCAAIEALFQTDSDKASLNSVELADDPSTKVQLCVVQLLGIANAEDSVPLLISKLTRSPEWEIRLHAAKAIGRIRSRHALTSLLEALTDPCSEVRGMAAWALGEIGDPIAFPALTSVISDQDVFASWSAENALKRIHCEEQRIEASDQARSTSSAAVVQQRPQSEESE